MHLKDETDNLGECGSVVTSMSRSLLHNYDCKNAWNSVSLQSYVEFDVVFQLALFICF